MSDISKFGSDDWLPSLKELCFEYLKNFEKRPGSRFIKFQDELLGTAENPGPIVQEYHRTAEKFKVETYGSNASTHVLDYHKIAALYIRAFLIYKPFINDAPAYYPDRSLYGMLPNEYFSIGYLDAIFKGWKKDFDGILQIPNHYYAHFIKLLYHFSCNPNSLDIPSLSNIIYLIEQLYFKRT